MYEIKAKDVLAYLNELGYKNIEAHQLKAFITDLKKLIKQDNYAKLDSINLLLNNNKHHTLHSIDTPKVQSNAERLVTVQICKPKFDSASINYDNRVAIGRISDKTTIPSSKDSLVSNRTQSNVTNNMLNAASSSTSSSLDNNRSENVRWKIHNEHSEGSITRPKSSFIRVKAPVLKPCRSDPVALYHYYRQQWKQTKIPGQDSHLDLRWTIREKLLGDHTIR